MFSPEEKSRRRRRRAAIRREAEVRLAEIRQVSTGRGFYAPRVLGAAFIVLAHEDVLFRASLLGAAIALVDNPEDAKELSAINRKH